LASAVDVGNHIRNDGEEFFQFDGFWDLLHGLQAFRRDRADDSSAHDVGGRVAKEIAIPSPDIARRIEYANHSGQTIG
jgi:hypothetical protein